MVLVVVVVVAEAALVSTKFMFFYRCSSSSGPAFAAMIASSRLSIPVNLISSNEVRTEPPRF